jgi:murein DD-endopeptidase MepM/ murein hydrolase activator NlpD
VRGEPAQPGRVLEITVSEPGLREVRGTAFDRPLAFYPGSQPGTWQALAGVDVAQAPGPATVYVEANGASGPPRSGSRTVVVGVRTFRTRQLRVASQFVDPSQTEVERLQAEAARLEAIFASVTPRVWTGSFAQPVPGVAGSNFGTRSVFNGEPRAPHAGVDFRGAVGTPIAAPAAGRIVLAEPLFFTGQTVIVDHGAGVFSLLAHLSRIDVAVGDSVGRGTTVGLLGATGRVTGPHLHWAVRLGTARVDALSLVGLLAPAQPRASRRRAR